MYSEYISIIEHTHTGRQGKKMKDYIITTREDSRGTGRVFVRVSKGRKIGISYRTYSCKGKEMEKRLGELAGTYAVVMQFENDSAALQYAKTEQVKANG